MFQIFLMYALFGSIFTVGKIGVEASQPYFLTGTRMLLAGVILLAFLLRGGRKNLIIPRECWPLIFLVAFFNVFITNAFEFWGLQYMTAGKTCLIYSLSPFAAALIGYYFSTEQMTQRKWLGLGVGICSFVPMMIGPWMESEGVDTMEIFAEGALMISAVTAVIGWNFVKKLTIDLKVSHPLVNGMSFLIAGVMCLLTSLFIEEWKPVPVFAWPEFTLCLLYIVVIHNLICYSIYAASLYRFSVTFMAFAGLSNPFFAGFFGWIFLGEEMQLPFLVAFVGVVIGLFFYYREEKELQAITD